MQNDAVGRRRASDERRALKSVDYGEKIEEARGALAFIPMIK